MIALLSRIPYRVIGWLAAAAGIIAIVVGLYFAIRDAGLQQGRAEVQAAWDAEKAAAAERLRWQEETLRARAAADDEANTAALAEIAAAKKSLDTSLAEATRNDPKFTADSCRAGERVRDAINSASRLSNPAAARR